MVRVMAGMVRDPRRGSMADRAPSRRPRSQIMRTLMNVLWFIFGGWISGTLWLLAGCVLAITVIGLPWTPAAFRMAGFSYFPFGKVVVDRDFGEVSLLLNILWLVFAGWWLALHHIVLAIPLAISIIGIPFAWQHVKLAGLALMPVGKEVLETY
jgi:uncharacterized membrane protein YccF (DUF307 family)